MTYLMCIKTIFLLCMMCFLVSPGSYAIESESKKPGDWHTIDSLNALSTSNWYINSESTLKLAQQALELSRNSGYKRGEAEALNNLGVGYYFSSDYDKVLDYYRRTLNMYEQMGDEEGITRAGTIYFRIAKYQKALENYKASLEITRKSGDRQQISKLISNIAEVYYNLGDYDSALQWYDNLLYNEEQLQDINGAAVTIEKIGRLHYSRANYEEALIEFNKLLKINNDLSSKTGIAAALNQIGSVYFMLKDYGMALKNFRQSLKIQIEINDEFGMATNYLNLARLDLTIKELPESLHWVQMAIILARKNNENEQLREGLKLLSLVYHDLGNDLKAFQSQLEYSNMLEKKTVKERNDQLANTLVLYELGQKKQENEILQARNENYRLTLEKQLLNKWRIVLGLTILLIIVAIGIIIYRYILKKNENIRLEEEVNQAIANQEQQQKIIFHQASLTSLGELAAGLAHEINQPMQNISLSAEAICDELEEQIPDAGFVKKTARGIFDDIERVKRIVDHIRIFSSGQKEEVNERFSPDEVILDVIKMMQQQLINHGITLKDYRSASTARISGNPHKFEQVILNLLSNARDAVDGITGKEKIVTISTAITDMSLIVEVADNGSGIDSNKLTDIFLPFYTTKKLGQGTGLGLSIAHGIIKQMNGSIVPESKLGEGTKMKIIIPFENNSNSWKNCAF